MDRRYLLRSAAVCRFLSAYKRHGPWPVAPRGRASTHCQIGPARHVIPVHPGRARKRATRRREATRLTSARYAPVPEPHHPNWTRRRLHPRKPASGAGPASVHRVLHTSSWTACSHAVRARDGRRPGGSGSSRPLVVTEHEDAVDDVHAQEEDAERPPRVGAADREQGPDRAEAAADDAKDRPKVLPAISEKPPPS
jgi:hypothetical protein